jgi:hypothetical protein
MLVTLKRGTAANDLTAFVRDVKFIPGVGAARALQIFNGGRLEVSIPEDKTETATRNLRRLALDGTLIVEGLPGIEPAKEPAPMPATHSTPAPTATPLSIDDNAAALLELLRKIGGGVNEARVLELIAANGGRPAHVTIDLTAPGIKLSGDSMMHHKFPLLAAAVAQRVNVMLVGPAGSGKTTACEQVAKALGLDFYATGAVNSEYKLTGFIDAQGRIVSTAFRRAFEHGGLFLFGETDGSMPGALLAFNTALANDWMDFPDGVIRKHPNFRVVADANTFGTGADRLYVGRNQLDAASLDRYAVIEWNYDEALEAAMIGLPAPKGSFVPPSITPREEAEVKRLTVDWFDRVRKVRGAVMDLKVRHVVSPRATVNGIKLLAAGWAWHDVEEAVIWKGLDIDTKNKVKMKSVQ